MSDSRFDPRFDPAFQRGWDGPVPSVLPESVRPADPERIVVAAEVPPEPELESDRRLNPFLIALGGVAALLVVAGLWMASQVSSGYSSNAPTQVDYAMLQLLMIAAPLTILLGVMTGIGVLFVFAVRWGNNR
jgi:hypothetical protein